MEAVEGNLSRASRFLEELYELSSWMNETRDLLEGHKAGKAGYNVDPEVKWTLEIVCQKNIKFISYSEIYMFLTFLLDQAILKRKKS